MLLANYADDNSLCVVRKLLHDVKYALEAEKEKAIRWFEENHMRTKPVNFQCMVHTKASILYFSISLGDIYHPSDIFGLLSVIINQEHVSDRSAWQNM